MSDPSASPTKTWLQVLLTPLLSLVAAFLVSGLVIVCVGENPLQAFRLLIGGALGSQDGIGYTLYYATSYLFTGLAVAVAYHAGLFNIGGEGQAYVGGLGSGLVCLALGQHSPWLVLPLAVLGGALFGALWALIPAWLYVKRGSHVVITTIMFNFIASAFMTWLLVNVLIKPGQASPETREFEAGGTMPPMHEWLGRLGIEWAATPWNASFLLALLAALGVWLLIWRTRTGHALRVLGANPRTAVFSGYSPSRLSLLALLLSGALAGCMGLNELLGAQHRILIDFPGGAGFVGVAVALMGRNHPFGIFLGALLFGALAQGGSQLSFDMPHINRDLVVVIQGLVILFCGALEPWFAKLVGRWFRKGGS